MKTMGVEKFLSWAFVHELAKGGGERGTAGAGSAWSALAQVAALGVRIQVGHRAGDFGGFVVESDPHPDALVAARAVRALAALVVDLPPDWGPAGDVLAACPPDLVPVEYAEMVARSAAAARSRIAGLRMAEHVVALVIAQATLGGAPDWRIEPPKADLVRDSVTGKPAWFIQVTREIGPGMTETVELFGAANGRVLPGAYRKWLLSPDPMPGLLARADYQIWRAAMDIVYADIASGVHGDLIAHALTPCAEPLAPWDGDAAAPAPRILVAA